MSCNNWPDPGDRHRGILVAITQLGCKTAAWFCRLDTNRKSVRPDMGEVDVTNDGPSDMSFSLLRRSALALIS